MCGGGAGGKTTVEERRPAQKHNYPSPVFFISGPRFLFLVFSRPVHAVENRHHHSSTSSGVF